MEKIVIIAAGGRGERMKVTLPKQFLELQQKTILHHTLQCFFDYDSTIKIIIALSKDSQTIWKEKNKFLDKNIIVVDGGKTRFQSVKKTLDYLKNTDNQSIVSIHDSVRPFISKKIIDENFSLAYEKGSAITAVELKDSLRKVTATENKSVVRGEYKIIQTPQTFRLEWLQKAYEQEESPFFTDDASVVECAGFPIYFVEGDYSNIKITTPEDLVIGTAFLENKKKGH